MIEIRPRGLAEKGNVAGVDDADEHRELSSTPLNNSKSNTYAIYDLNRSNVRVG